MWCLNMLHFFHFNCTTFRVHYYVIIYITHLTLENWGQKDNFIFLGPIFYTSTARISSQFWHSMCTYITYLGTKFQRNLSIIKGYNKCFIYLDHAIFCTSWGVILIVLKCYLKFCHCRKKYFSGWNIYGYQYSSHFSSIFGRCGYARRKYL